QSGCRSIHGCAGCLRLTKTTLRSKHADESALKNNASLKKRLRGVNGFLGIPKIIRKWDEKNPKTFAYEWIGTYVPSGS
ncbi:MAG: hypothetical protein K6C30_05700, partial [Bacteroidaceae bacterium]|nr:hypothetical protein [Bacteroidaceae bacterium]